MDQVQGAPVRCGVLVISDRCHRKEVQDESGPCLVELLRGCRSFTASVELISCVPDNVDAIQAILKNWTDVLGADVIITSGGTGFGVRDHTPEATSEILDREAHGMMVALFQQSYPHSILSRGVCGTRKNTLIMNFPGSPKACKECFMIVEPKLRHIIDLLRNNVVSISKEHHEKFVNAGNPAGDGPVLPGVAFRLRQSPYPIVPVEEAQQMVFKEAELVGEEVIHLHDALGRILARDVAAQDPLPPFRASIKDGYAVLAADKDGNRKVLGASHAGMVMEKNMLAGACLRITTGAPLPEGADAVVQVEHTELVEHDAKSGEELIIKILKVPTVGQDIRAVGSDIPVGAVVASAGMELDPACLGVLATCGATRVTVYRKPVIGILSTGDELVLPEVCPLPHGKIRDSNKTVLLSTFRSHGFTALDFGIAMDSLDVLVPAFRKAASFSDVVVLTGGVSMGEKDLVKPLITQVFGGTIYFGRVFMKPGLPTTFATVMMEGRKKLIFGLPGNPVSAAVTCSLFVLPTVRKMSGYLSFLPTVIRAEASKDIKLDPRPEYHRALLDWKSGKNWPVAHSTGHQISSRLLSVSGAEALLCLPAKSEQKQAILQGEMLDAILL